MDVAGPVLVKDSMWTGCADGIVRVFDDTSRVLLHELRLPFKNSAEILSIAAYGSTVFTAGVCPSI